MKLTYFIVLVLLTACTTTPKTDAVLIIDQTEERGILDEQTLLSIFDIPHGRITITEIIDQSLSRDISISKPKSLPYFLRVESKLRKQDKAFRDGFLTGLAKFNKPSDGLSQSYCYSVLARVCKKLAQSEADNKFILISGDLLHHTDDFSFYSYRKNPAQIMKDYDQIIETFESQFNDIRGESLDGIHISVAFFPSKENDRLYREVRKFWSRYFAEKNSNIEFVTSLHYSSQISTL
ncbi:hypothetical protein QQ020_23420 [Fulvivirgaceae bacterium BMA12]|uniref:Lipoprotein n=1 Tax=Agaribacillus aureus TaxID=3051825 RepID=A0ABT8LDB0_9BACT|nr:hypothetical protein [Fulvivirgaceae bacterium BMA12]